MGIVIVLLFIIVILTVLGDFDSPFLLSFLLFKKKKNYFLYQLTARDLSVWCTAAVFPRESGWFKRPMRRAGGLASAFESTCVTTVSASRGYA